MKELGSRVRANWPLKLILGVCLTVGFPAIYAGVLQRHPVFPVTTMQISWLDRMIPFAPGWVYVYESIWLLMPIAPWLTKTRLELAGYCRGFVFMSVVGFFVFFAFPTMTPRPTDVHNANGLYMMLIHFDNGINACPSFHAAFAVYHAAWCHVLFDGRAFSRRMRWGVWVWAAGILASTLLTKQHVAADILAGAVLGLSGFAVSRSRMRPSPEQEGSLDEQQAY